MMVSRSAHEEALVGLARSLDSHGLSPESGIHGPKSIAWRINAEAVNFLGAGCAVLLQLAHPYVAYGIAEHSTAMSNVRKRFQGTFESIYRMTFGTREEAFESARAIHRVHSRISGRIAKPVGRFAAGHEYHANEVEALRWVFSTLVSTASAVHCETGLRLSREDQARFYEESKRFGLLFGLTESMLPRTLDDFERYMREMLAGDTIVVCEPAREIGSFLLTAPFAAAEPIFVVYRAVTAKFLGDTLSRAYGLPRGKKELAIARLALQASRPIRSLSPMALRLMPDALRAEARLGLRGKSHLSPVVEGLMHRVLDAWPAQPR